MHIYLAEFDGVSCKGCVLAIERKFSNIKDIDLIKIDKTTGSSILQSEIDKISLKDYIHSFQGCCTNCQINLKSLTEVTPATIVSFFSSSDENVLIKNQYKRALENFKTKKEVACNDYCVCKTTNINRFEEFSEAPSLSSIYNLVHYLKEFGYFSKGISVVDYGCGTGHDAFLIAPLINPGKILGIDVTQEMIDFVNQTAINLHITNVSFHQSDNLQSFTQNSQDLIITNNVFNILINKFQFLNQTFQVLKSDGILVIADEFTINPLSEGLRNDPAFQCGGIAGAKPSIDLIKQLREIGFTLIREEVIRTYEITYKHEKFGLNSEILIFSKK